MKSFPTKMTFGVVILLFLAGCSVSPRSARRPDPGPPPQVADSGQTPSLIQPSDRPPQNDAVREKSLSIDTDDFGNSYYYFTEAQLELRHGRFNNAIAYLRKAIQMDPDSVFLRNELVVTYLQLKDLEGALQAIKSVLEIDPGNLEAQILHGKIEEGLGNRGAAKSIFEEILARNPERESIYLILGGLYLEDQEMEKALPVYQALVRQFPDSYAGHYFLGKVYMIKDEPAKAVQEFKKSLALEPDLIEPRFELIELYRSGPGAPMSVTVKAGDSISRIARQLYGRYDPAIREKVLALNPDLKAPDRLLSGQVLQFPATADITPSSPPAAKNTSRILALYNEILALEPRNTRAKLGLAAFYRETGYAEKSAAILAELGKESAQNPAVIQAFLKFHFDENASEETVFMLRHLLEGAPENSDLHYLLGVAYDKQEKKELALKQFENVKPGTNFFQNAVLLAAFQFYDQKSTEKAIQFLQAKIAQAPDNPEFFFYIGSFFKELENYAQAADYLQQGLALDPENTKYRFQLGVVYDLWGEKEKSIAAMKIVLQQDPEDPNALNYLGYTYADMGIHLDEAERLIQKALTHRPDDGYITDSLGWVYFQRGLYQKAVEILEKAYELVPDDPIILEHLGDAYLKVNDRKRALEFYERSLLKKEKEKDREILLEKVEQLKKEGGST